MDRYGILLGKKPPKKKAAVKARSKKARTVECPACDGAGYFNPISLCPKCKGIGRIEEPKKKDRNRGKAWGEKRKSSIIDGTAYHAGN